MLGWLFNTSIVGWSNMGGCLGPKRNRTYVYLDLLQQIYTEGGRVELHQVRGSPAYDLIKEKLGKKGLLKKLVEHLSSHRNYLTDCVQANRRMMADLNTYTSRATGLVVSNTLIHNLESFEAVILLPREASHGVIKLKKPATVNPRDGALSVGSSVDFGFENTIFRQSIDLYDNETSLRERVLEGLSEFAKFKQEKFICDRLVAAILNRLHRDISSHDENFIQTCKTFGELLQRSTDSSEVMDSSAEALVLFLSIWVREAGEDTRFYCEDVIRIYLSRCTTTRDYGSIYSVIFLVYDRHLFEQGALDDLEDLLLQIVGEEQSKLQFMKGMFRYLLTYLSVTSNPQVMQSNWEIGAFEMHYEMVKGRFRNVLSRESKLNALKKLYQWLNRGQLNLNELIVFNRDTLTCCFIINILSSHRDQELLNSFLKTFYSICNRCEPLSVYQLFEAFLDAVFRIDQRVVEPGSILVRICSELAAKYRVMYSGEESQLIRPMELQQPHQTRLELLYLYDVMLRECTPPLSAPMVEATAKMLYSLYANLYANQTLQQKLRLVEFICPLLATLQSKGEVELLIVFNRKLETMQGQNSAQIYLQRYLSLEVASLLQIKDCVPRQIREINRLVMRGEPVAHQEIEKYIKNGGSSLWTSQSSTLTAIRDKHTHASSKKVQFLQRQFDKHGDLQESRVPVDVQIQDRNKNSVVSETIKGDESLEHVFGLIRDGGGRRADERPSSKLWGKEKIQTSRHA